MSKENIWELVPERDKANYEVDDSVVFPIDDPKDQRIIEKKWGEADGTQLSDGRFLTKLRGNQVVRDDGPYPETGPVTCKVPTYRWDMAVPKHRE